MFGALVRSFSARRGRRQALHELNRLVRHEGRALVLDGANPLTQAKVAVEAGDKNSALHLWAQAKSQYPEYVLKSHDSLAVLLGLQLFDEGEMLMRAAQKRYPRDSFYPSGYAMIAERRGDPEECARRWEAVRKRFPGNWMGFVFGAMALGQKGDLPGADALLAKAVRRFPHSLAAWREYPRIAEQRNDWPEALRRWKGFPSDFKNPIGDIGIARALQQLERLEEAEAHAQEALTRFPLNSELWISLARIRSRTNDRREAARAWADVRLRFPALPLAYQEGARLHREMGELEEAERLASEGLRRFPTASWPLVEAALAAHHRQAWDRAADLWAQVRDAWPEREDGVVLGAEALRALGRSAEADALRARRRA